MKLSPAISYIRLRSGLLLLAVASISRKINSSTSFSLKIFTALTGSPTYLGLLNLQVLTNPLFCKRRQGIILGINISSQAGKIAHYFHAEFMTFFRVKLNTGYIIF